jgi:UDP-N-acetylglucosamine diphosphorylase / glucose-1-phosphate thymidylyltransferase / UDP-N-acetylgalactosamine diphosphorylase / glucosamine-1-phosphate N-acetyltransferase / galactosamine-1-phosphate N-acetyltransferase
MPIILFTEDGCNRDNLYPFTLTRSIQQLRVGILTLQEKWERMLGMPSQAQWQGHYLDAPSAVKIKPGMEGGPYLLLKANVLPTPALARQVKKLRPGTCLLGAAGEVVALAFSENQVLKGGKIKVIRTVAAAAQVATLEYAWQIVQLNDAAIRQDMSLLTAGRRGRALPKSNRTMGKHPIFVEPGAMVEHAILNATDGPIYIGRNALVMEGCLLRGPLALCEGAVLKMGAQVYGATTLGPYCTGGGEIKNSLLMGYSNKAHHGYLGDSVIGEWCNLGAGATNSNIKNNAGPVHYPTGSGTASPGNKGGLLMGDHSKAAINTAFNTGAVVGVCCNVFGSGLSPAHIPSFAWGMDGQVRYRFDRAMEDIGNWKKLKGHGLTDAEQQQLKHIFDHSIK